MTVHITHFRIPVIENDELEWESPGETGTTPDGVAWRYSRRYGFYNSAFRGLTPAVRGGETEIEVQDSYGWVLAVGYGNCSLSENFDYAEGRRVAALRAIKRALVEGQQLSEEDADTLLDMVNTGERINY